MNQWLQFQIQEVIGNTRLKVGFMKNFLVTWYGITDFKSSLGFEKSGPILGALADGDYTDVIVLGYTKHDDSISNEEFKFKIAKRRKAYTISPSLIKDPINDIMNINNNEFI